MHAEKLFNTLARKSGETTEMIRRQDVTAITETPAPQLNLKVLVAEDNPTGQMVATAMLEKLGCHPDIAANGLEAVQMFERKEYDIVFMDWHMPVMDGSEATAKIREKNPSGRRVPIIAFTAGVQEADREKFLQAGVDDFILKPATRKTLEAVLHRWVTKSAESPHEETLPPLKKPAPICNEEEALGFVDGDRELLGQLAVSFCETTPALMENLKNGIARRDSPAVIMAAHTLKGSARMFAASDTVTAASVAEEAGKTNDWPTIETAYHELEAELARLVPELIKLSAVIV
jgi:CheY-like chemotaxis protein/HPt (histidine-containing phosphotransfer) domain-containing protein